MLLFVVLLPAAGMVLTILFKPKNERGIAQVSFVTVGLHLAAVLTLFGLWAAQHFPTINVRELVLYRTQGYEFLIDFYLDRTTMAFLFTGSLITFLVVRYSRYYLHLEQGFKRFFLTMLLFFFGYNLTVLAGNFETLFAGWEVLGLSSFLLIAFYRDRYLPVRNAVKVFSIYRIGDVGVLLAMWASHHLWHENITFAKLQDQALVARMLQEHESSFLFISLCLLVAAAAKSAQLPFSSWLPRAMEGPTTSSAIFYGSLSVHFGVFLLLRTYPFWEQETVFRVLVAGVGVSTALVALSIARVQSSIKTQIAYASIAQIGIMFVEVALGFTTLALLHFGGNAFLRTYQLLVSPGVVSYRIREQVYEAPQRRRSVEDILPRKWVQTFYVLALREWYLDAFMNRMVFTPLKRLGRRLDFLSTENVLLYFLPLYGLGLIVQAMHYKLPVAVLSWLPEAFAFVALLMVLKAFSERHHPRLAWLLVTLHHAWIALAITFNDHLSMTDLMLHLVGVIFSGVAGFALLLWLKRHEPAHFDLNKYYGHVYEHPRLALGFLVASLGLMGFPITSTFIGEDILFSHIEQDQFWLALFNALNFILAGIALIRIYARLFLGPHAKTYHETTLPSA